MITEIRSLIPNSLVNHFYHLPKAVFANVVFGFPSRGLRVIGVTGTDGKTTTATLIYHILKKAGKKVALISTVSVKIGKEEIETGLHVTSPEPWILQKFLKKIKDSGFEFVVLEVTSHGLAQNRVWGVDFEIGVITNVTPEHLDYHKTFKAYLETKAGLLRKVKYSVLDREEKNFNFLKKRAGGRRVTYGLNKGDFTLKNFPFKTPLPGKFNQLNCLAAISVAKILGVRDEVIRKAVMSFRGVKGRMQEIDEDQDFKVIIDFAHTPNALKKALTTLREVYKPKRLIAVFGCAGLRDRKKRPLMGRIAAGKADVVVLTAEDPRTENVGEIIEQIAQGCRQAGALEDKNFFKVPDREKATEFALRKAGKGDLVGIFGKGHEKSMCFGKTEIPWSDEKVTRSVLVRMKKQ